MKLRLLLLVTLPFLSLTLRAADEKPAAGAPPAGARPHRETTELGEHMEKIGRAFRAIGRAVADPAKNAESLKQVAIIRANAEAAAKLKPAKAADIPAEQQPKFMEDYEAGMKHFLADVDALETALKANDNAAAAALVKKMKGDMDQSHKEFRKKKPDDM